MRVARLEVFGFKSFMDRLVLPLEAGITGVVGPNGCGKSNIVDAIRWILGETKASSLRGGTLEDVIFNGTDKLRPLGLAEVTLTLRAHNDNFFADLVSPQREVEEILKNLEVELEKQEQEYAGAGNSSAIKLRVIEGGLDNATDGEKGTVHSMADHRAAEANEEGSDPETLQEDATTIALDTESDTEISDEAGKEPVSTSVLTRFAWLKAVSEVQITRRLYRSGESEFFINRVQCRLKDIKDFFRALGLGARAYTIVAQGEVSRIVTAKPEERRLIIEEAAGVLGFRDKIAASNRKLEETSHNVTRLTDVINEIERGVKSLKKQAERAENRQSLKDEIARLELAVFEDKANKYSGSKTEISDHLQKSQQLLDDKSHELVTLNTKEEAEKLGSAEIDTESDRLRLQIDARREELLARARQKSQRQSKIDELRAFNLARLTEIKRIEERREVLKLRQQTADSGIQELKQKESLLQVEVDSIELVSEEDLRNVAISLKNKRDGLRIKEGEVRANRDKVVSTQSSINAMQEQIVAASPLQQLKNSINAGELSALSAGTSIFVEGLVVPAAYTKAVQSILAEKAAFLVSDSAQNIAELFLKTVDEKDTKSAKGRGIGILARGEQSSIREERKFDGLNALIDCIEVKPAFVRAASHLLHNIFVTETSAEAFAFFQANPDERVTIVTKNGEIHTAVSFFSLRHEGGLIQLQAKVITLQEELVKLQDEQKNLLAARDEIQDEVTALEQSQSDLLKRSEIQQRSLRDFSSQLASVRGRLQAELRGIEQISQDVERTANQIKDVEQKIQDSKAEEERLLELAKVEIGGDESEIEKEITALSESLKTVDQKRQEKRRALSDIAQAQSATRNGLDSIRQDVNRLTFSLEKLELERQGILDRLHAEYGDSMVLNFDAPSIPENFMADADVRAYEQEALKIRSRIAREGEVDSSSVERYQEEAARLQELVGQRADLESACDVLKKTILKLEEVSKLRFVAMFNAVSKNFSRLIPQLFGGGKGSLELTLPDKPLESGIDILVRPPGKKPKNIDLLSGGEKALCATALIFAMFLEKPSPLCVLDEVDAPLDEANLIRFLSLVKEMSNRTQFLLVTHNKRSMSTSDNLIGVTMQEPGSSKVISVSLQDAYSQVA